MNVSSLEQRSPAEQVTPSFLVAYVKGAIAVVTLNLVGRSELLSFKDVIGSPIVPIF